jgi:hypothetical protein
VSYLSVSRQETACEQLESDANSRETLLSISGSSGAARFRPAAQHTMIVPIGEVPQVLQRSNLVENATRGSLFHRSRQQSGFGI